MNPLDALREIYKARARLATWVTVEIVVMPGEPDVFTASVWIGNSFVDAENFDGWPAVFVFLESFAASRDLTVKVNAG